MWAERLSFNQAIRDGDGLGHGYWLPSTARRGNPNLWNATGGKGAADGIHPHAATHAAIASGLAADATDMLGVGHYV